MISNLALSLIVFRVIVAASVAVKGLNTLSAVYWFHEATPCEQANLSFLGRHMISLCDLSCTHATV